MSLITWKKNNNDPESPTAPELRRSSKRVRISVVVRATARGHPQAWSLPGNRFLSQSAHSHPAIPSTFRRRTPRRCVAQLPSDLSVFLIPDVVPSWDGHVCASVSLSSPFIRPWESFSSILIWFFFFFLHLRRIHNSDPTSWFLASNRPLHLPSSSFAPSDVFQPRSSSGQS